MGPKRWEHFGQEKAAQFDKDEYHIDYALANFNVGWSIKGKQFGTRYFPMVPNQAADETPWMLRRCRKIRRFGLSTVPMNLPKKDLKRSEPLQSP